MTSALPMPVSATAEGRVENAFRHHRGALVGFARLMTGSASAAEEAVQEAFVSFHRFCERVPPDKELAYLRRAITNQAKSRWRRRSIAERNLRAVATDAVDTKSPADAAILAATRVRIDAALQQLSARQRACVALYYFADLSLTDVAETLDISEGSVKTHLHRGRAALAPLLEELR